MSARVRRFAVLVPLAASLWACSSEETPAATPAEVQNSAGAGGTAGSSGEAGAGNQSGQSAAGTGNAAGAGEAGTSSAAGAGGTGNAAGQTGSEGGAGGSTEAGAGGTGEAGAAQGGAGQGASAGESGSSGSSGSGEAGTSAAGTGGAAGTGEAGQGGEAGAGGGGEFVCLPAAQEGEFYALSAESLEQLDPVSMCQYRGKVVLVVNVASACGYTPQYGPLQAIYDKYKDQGFEILGFPCNQFGNQESGTDAEISAFCTEEYGIKFPMFSKIEVNGPNQDPIYTWLKSQPGGEGDIPWNFTKFLLGRDGKLVKRIKTATEPDAPEVIKLIEGALAASP